MSSSLKKASKLKLSFVASTIILSSSAPAFAEPESENIVPDIQIAQTAPSGQEHQAVQSAPVVPDQQLTQFSDTMSGPESAPDRKFERKLSRQHKLRSKDTSFMRKFFSVFENFFESDDAAVNDNLNFVSG